MVQLRQRELLDPARYPSWTLVWQAIGSVRLALEALRLRVPEVSRSLNHSRPCWKYVHSAAAVSWAFVVSGARNRRFASTGVQASSGQQLRPTPEETIDQYNTDRRPALRWLHPPRSRFCIL